MNKTTEKIEMDTVLELPAFSLKGGSGYDESGYKFLYVSYSELKNSEVGKEWRIGGGWSYRDDHSASAEVVYKTSQGVAILFHIYYTTDSPEPVEEKIVRLAWYEFHD